MAASIAMAARCLWARPSFALNTALRSGRDCLGSIASDGNNLIGDTSGCGIAAAATGRANLGPHIGSLSNNGGPTRTLPVLMGSPAIDAVPR